MGNDVRREIIRKAVEAGWTTRQDTPDTGGEGDQYISRTSKMLQMAGHCKKWSVARVLSEEWLIIYRM